MSAANLGLRFLLELVGIVAVAYWGYQAADGAARWILALAAPGVLAVAWAVLIAPGARNPLPQDVRLVLGSVVLLGAWALLALAGHPSPALAFAALVVANTILLFVLR